MTTETNILFEILKQWPYFALLVALWYGFYRFLERTYADHKEYTISLQATFKESLELIMGTFWGRLDKIEATLEKGN